jgi:hypothetical protein
MGREVVVAVTEGRLDFGTWERILGVSWMADTGVLMAGGGSGCWSRSLGRLYSRLGFEVVHETETHYVMRVQNQTDAGDGKARA